MPINEEEKLSPELENAINEQIGATPEEMGAVAKPYEPVYKMRGDSKIPVSKSHGKIWKGRKDAGLKAVSCYHDSWHEAIRYYNNDQSEHRDGNENEMSQNTQDAKTISDSWTQTENIVYANVQAMIPALYAKNPSAEFTTTGEDKREYARKMEKLINEILYRPLAPGVNIKGKAKRAVKMALLTNEGWMEIGYTFKDADQNQALQDIDRLSKELAETKDVKRIEEIEGELQALESVVEFLNPEGLFTKFVSPFEMIIDPASKEYDLSDANWMMKGDYLPTSFLLAKFGKKDEDGKKFMSIYEPTHVLASGSNGETTQDQINNFSLFKQGDAAKAFGYEDEEAFENAKHTKVWFVWDKVTRRVYMYHDKHWTFPIWVWDDPLGLDRFFPFYRLSYFENPIGTHAKGEVSYYLDQQDAINDIHSERARWRMWTRQNIIFDSRVPEETVSAIFSGDMRKAKSVKVPEGFKMADLAHAFAPPSINYQQVFDMQPELNAIDRVSSVRDVMRGAQFKTNTTNKAIEEYSSISNQRIDERIDSIEDWLSDIIWGLAQLCMMHMSGELAQQLINEDFADWKNLSRQEVMTYGRMRVVGGSTQKPTSAAKKAEALQISQILGQFASVPPVAMVVLKVLKSAFENEMTLDQSDWDMITSYLEQQMGGVSGQLGQLDQLPPQAIEAVMKMLQRGVPLGQSIAAVIGENTNAEGQPNGQQPANSNQRPG